MTAETIRPGEAMDAVFAGHTAELLDRTGLPQPMALRRWTGPADHVDRALLLDRCHGRTLDVGCGPGRLVEGLAGLHGQALGIDVSTEAVRLTLQRGAQAVRGDVFATVPGEGRWDCALLADGNIGIGGRPDRLLRRIGRILRPTGHIVVELDPDGSGVQHHQWRFRVGDQLTPLFDWAVVGVDAIASVARSAGFIVDEVATAQDRHVAVLRRVVAAA